MYTLNHVIDRTLIDSDGLYLNNQDLMILEKFSQSFAVRMETYELLRDSGPKVVQQALQRLFQGNPELVQKHAQRCQYDMTEVVRYIALAILRDDEEFFKETMMSWLDTILVAHRRTEHCAIAYRYLQEAIDHTLPATSSQMIQPYTSSIVMTLQSHV